MSYTILTESYGRRLPKITAEADSTDDLAVLGIDYAEGSTCTVGEDEYVLDKVGGWVIPGSGGGGGGGSNLVILKEVNESLEVSAKDLIDYTKAEKAVVLLSVNAGETIAWSYWLGWVGYYSDDSLYEAKFIGHNGDNVREIVFGASTETDMLQRQ